MNGVDALVLIRSRCAAARRWPMWSLPKHALLYVLAVDAAAICAVALIVRQPITAGQCATAGVLSGAALVHLHLSRLVERIRRDHSSRTPHVDLLSVWIFPAALLLPPSLAAAEVVLIWAHRWWLVGRYDANRPPHRLLFTVAMLILSALCASGVVTASGLRGHLGTSPDGRADFVVIVVAAAAYWVANSALVAGVIALTTKIRQARDVLGSVGDNLLDVSALVLGTFVALALAWWPPFAVLMVVPAVALHRTVLIHQLELAARSDEKTGVLNAVAWTQQSRSELERTIRHAGSMALFMIDMDGFKQVNDEHGHLVGDTVLQRVARVLAAEVRRTDTVGRFGGDEFAVLLPATDVAEALVVAERIRREIRQLPVPVAAGLSTSIGVAVYPHVAEDSIEGLLAAADAALYWAKDNGRDQIRLAGRHRSVPWLPTVREPADGRAPEPASGAEV